MRATSSVARERFVLTWSWFSRRSTSTATGWLIASLNRAQLAKSGIDVPLIPVSSALRLRSRDRGEHGLDIESGYPALVEWVRSHVEERADEIKTATVTRDVADTCDQLTLQFETEQRALTEPEHTAAVIEELRSAEQRAEHLASGAARWQTALNDGMQDLTSDIEHDLRGSPTRGDDVGRRSHGRGRPSRRLARVSTVAPPTRDRSSRRSAPCREPMIWHARSPPSSRTSSVRSRLRGTIGGVGRSRGRRTRPLPHRHRRHHSRHPPRWVRRNARCSGCWRVWPGSPSPLPRRSPSVS